MSTNRLEEQFKIVGELAATYMQTYLKDNDVNSTGDLSRNIDVKVNEKDNIIDVSIEMPEYGKFVDEGRKGKGKYNKSTYRRGGGFPPIKAIKEWIKQKPISLKGGASIDTAAFLIGRKIYEEGIKPKPFIQYSIERAIEDSEDAVYDALENDIGFTIEESFTTNPTLKKTK